MIDLKLEEPTPEQQKVRDRIIELTTQLAARSGASLQLYIGGMTVFDTNTAHSKIECSDGKAVDFTIIDRATSRPLNSPLSLFASVSVGVDQDE